MHNSIGVDPASGKASCIWRGESFEFVRPQGVREKLESILSSTQEKYVVAWDAPISFSETSYSDRLIDKVARTWVKEKVASHVFEHKAINAMPFSGLAHWVISCVALGFPFGEPLAFTTIPEERGYANSNGHQVIEVHPAVSMGVMWADKEIKLPFPIYKKTVESMKIIVEHLDFPVECAQSDDILDAYVAHLMADMFVNGQAEFLTPPKDGSYVLPLGKSFKELSLLERTMG